LVKGISRRVIVVDSPDPQIFEQAIFILRTDGGGISSQQLVDQAVRIAKNYARCQGMPRRRRRIPAWLWASIGAAAIGLTWLLCAIL
jgi:hypothetical protein